MPKQSQFPSPVYAEAVLAVNFADAQRYFLDSLLDIQYAHTVMLAEQNVIPMDAAAACLRALDGLDRKKLRTHSYDGRFEDLFFYVENQLAEACGQRNAGYMHTARSRNDIDITMYRMCLREEILRIAEALYSSVTILLELAERNRDTVMPAYTHTQPAQPTTLAHYLLGATECFVRDETRLEAAFATVNRNPLGSCAITTTGFPIDRHRTAELLGFEGLQLNSYGAIVAIDYVTETAGVLATAAVNLGKLAQDLLLWCNPELGFLRLSDAWVQISSIMPQKRNPVALEHVRILASKTLGQAQAVFTSVHNTPFGDIVDCEDDLQPLVFSMTNDATRSFRLFGGLLSDCEVNKNRLAERAQGDFLTVTELADTLSREEHISFREAHQLVSRAVRNLNGMSSHEAIVEAVSELAPEIVGHELKTSEQEMRHALDAKHFVEVRTIAGGPGRESLDQSIAAMRKQVEQHRQWIEAKRALLAGARILLHEASTALVKPS